MNPYEAASNSPSNLSEGARKRGKKEKKEKKADRGEKKKGKKGRKEDRSPRSPTSISVDSPASLQGASGRASVRPVDANELLHSTAKVDVERQYYEEHIKELENEVQTLTARNAELLDNYETSQTALLERRANIDRSEREIASAETKTRLAALEVHTATERCAMMEKTLDELRLASQREYDALEGDKHQILQENRDLLERIRELENSNVRDRLEQALNDVAELTKQLEKLKHTEEITMKETDDYRQDKIDAACEVQGLTNVGRKLEAHVRVLEGGLQRLADRCRVLEFDRNAAVTEYQELQTRAQHEKDEWQRAIGEQEERFHLCVLAQKEDRVEFNRIFGDQTVEWSVQLKEAQVEMANALAERDAFEDEIIQVGEWRLDVTSHMEQKEEEYAVLESVLKQTERAYEDLSEDNEASKGETTNLRVELEKQEQMRTEADNAAMEMEERCRMLSDILQETNESAVTVEGLLPNLWGKRLDELPQGVVKFLSEGFLPTQLPPLKVWPSAPVPPIPEKWRLDAIEESATLKDALFVALEQHAAATLQLEEANVLRVKAEIARNKAFQKTDEWKNKHDSARRQAIAAQREAGSLMRFLDKLECDKSALSHYSARDSEVAYGSEVSISREDAEAMLGDLMKLREKLESGGVMNQSSSTDSISGDSEHSTNDMPQMTPVTHTPDAIEDEKMHMDSVHMKRHTFGPSPRTRDRVSNHENAIATLRPPTRATGNATEVAMRGGNPLQRSLGDLADGLNGVGRDATQEKLQCPVPNARSVQSLTINRRVE
eukprot:GEMP01010045.1.p1 GENE.GEMP01010045.1~~GEMP01010045.1.p1  ORF type:complete len:781 (+),score=230.88 GEMP01010045.1:296-2638(+)